MKPVTRLATYGSLRPGQLNHDQLALIHGRWFRGEVHGRLIDDGWAAALGYPALVLDSEAPPVAVDVFESSELPDHWARLDEFEGPEYTRVVTQVQTETGLVDAWIYVAAV